MILFDEPVKYYYYHYVFSCYSLLKNSLNYDNNKLFYVNFHYFSLFSWLFIVSIMFFDFR